MTRKKRFRTTSNIILLSIHCFCETIGISRTQKTLKRMVRFQQLKRLRESVFTRRKCLFPKQKKNEWRNIPAKDTIVSSNTTTRYKGNKLHITEHTQNVTYVFLCSRYWRAAADFTDVEGKDAIWTTYVRILAVAFASRLIIAQYRIIYCGDVTSSSIFAKCCCHWWVGRPPRVSHISYCCWS